MFWSDKPYLPTVRRRINFGWHFFLMYDEKSPGAKTFTGQVLVYVDLIVSLKKMSLDLAGVYWFSLLQVSTSKVLINRVVHNIFSVMQEWGTWEQDTWALFPVAEQGTVDRTAVALPDYPMALKSAGQVLLWYPAVPLTYYLQDPSPAARYWRNCPCYGLKGNTGARRWPDLAEACQQIWDRTSTGAQVSVHLILWPNHPGLAICLSPFHLGRCPLLRTMEEMGTSLASCLPTTKITGENSAFALPLIRDVRPQEIRLLAKT